MIRFILAAIAMIMAGAEADATAVRGASFQATDTLPPPEYPGLNGLPFAPTDLSGCDEMSWYREQAGLVERFDGVGYRESRCRNDVSSWCCHGYWQIHRMHVNQLGHCDITSTDDFLGTDPLDKQRNACAAAYIYSVQGGDAWDAW